MGLIAVRVKQTGAVIMVNEFEVNETVEIVGQEKERAKPKRASKPKSKPVEVLPVEEASFEESNSPGDTGEETNKEWS